jgi:hypothetical protein
MTSHVTTVGLPGGGFGVRKLFANSVAALLLTVAMFPAPAAAGTLIVSIQRGGQAAIISRGAFRDCRSAGQDAWNLERCSGWKSLGRGSSPRTGRFCVQGWWPDGGRFREGVDMSRGIEQYALAISPQARGTVKEFC